MRPICNLVYETFIGKILNNVVISNIDGDIQNNNINNLKLNQINYTKIIEFKENDIWKNIPEYEGRYIANIKTRDIKSLSTDNRR